MPELSRRFFLGGAIALVAAQTFKPSLASTNIPRIYGDGKHDDSYGFTQLLTNQPVIFNKDQIGIDSHQGVVIRSVPGVRFRIDNTVEITKEGNLTSEGHWHIIALNLPEDAPLIAFEEGSFDQTKMDMILDMNEKRKVPLFRNRDDWRKGNFTGKKTRDYDYVDLGKVELL